MKKLLTLTLSLLLLGTLFTSCKQNELPPELTQTGPGTGYYDDYVVPTEYTNAYMTNGHGSYRMYKNNFYYCNNASFIEYIHLNDPNVDLRTLKPSKDGAEFAVQHSICTDPLCGHTFSDQNCLAYSESMLAQFLIDEVESAGGNPVFYIIAYPNFDRLSSDIYRLDSSAGTKEVIVSVSETINKMAVYEDSIYFVTQSSDDTYKLNMIKKTGGDVVSLTPGGGSVRMIGGNKYGIFVSDNEGRIYLVDHALESAEVIYTLDNIYTDSSGYFSAFIDGDYLYYDADYEAVEVPELSDSFGALIRTKNSLYRVRIDNPKKEEAELVATDVFEGVVYGIYKGELYYAPMDMQVVTTNDESSENLKFDDGITDFSCNDGEIRAVNLTTLETRVVIKGCGLDISVGPAFLVTDRFIIGVMWPYRTGFGLLHEYAGSWMVLYDFESGAIYRMSECVAN